MRGGGGVGWGRVRPNRLRTPPGGRYSQHAGQFLPPSCTARTHLHPHEGVQEGGGAGRAHAAKHVAVAGVHGAIHNHVAGVLVACAADRAAMHGAAWTLHRGCRAQHPAAAAHLLT